ncbi:hypothetical protein [Aidingimonas halophila]|uniref:Uncharacterized protein n=1 Tax=Aidingimonas halophila TaxID=574349 RepID=A0A1H3EV16_9GAMM|nr:hypothetical protein [Aidingimonas halophila]GHC31668.1 hypothetical protein GCM10008094_25320 [Aidingimonas halophila]SDX81774.1 hypothetical protein SAMN05443545_107237 [Aidingimonas halophila]
MLISDSIPLLWVAYILLSVIVLVTGYLGIRFVPRLPRLMITGIVAGTLWMPWRFSLPLMEEEGGTYQGIAPAIVVTTVDFLQGGLKAAPLVMVAIGALSGAMAGAAVWWFWPRQADGSSAGGSASNKPEGGVERQERREPVIG